MSRPTHAELAATLLRLRLGVSASDLHGSLSGYLCGGGRVAAGAWPDALALDVDAAAVATDPVLRRFEDEVQAQYASVPAQPEPLLPARETALSIRADALVDWCRGFLGGFGLSGAGAHGPLSGEAAEIVADFGGIAASRFEVGADDAAAFGEVLEFVRMGAALLHRDLHERAARRALH